MREQNPKNGNSYTFMQNTQKDNTDILWSCEIGAKLLETTLYLVCRKVVTFGRNALRHEHQKCPPCVVTFTLEQPIDPCYYDSISPQQLTNIAYIGL